MKLIGAICLVLLVVTIILQIGILSRLDALTKRPVAVAAPYSPSAAAIAAEIRKQMAREARLAGPPSFSFQHRNSSTENGQLKYAAFTLTREDGPATSLGVVGPAGITSRITRVESTEDYDRYELSFRPDSGFLPPTWEFTLRYADRSNALHEQRFLVTYLPNEKAPNNFKIQKQ